MSDDLVGLISTSTLETLYMVVLVTIIGLVIGFPLGVILAVSDKGNIVSLPKTNKLLATIINIIRSLPEIILIIILLPLSRVVIGTTLGTNAAIVPLSIGSAPFLQE